MAKRGDRFIIRRPTPPETIGGGVVIDAHGQKYRFGLKTIERLQQKMQLTPKEQLLERLKTEKLLSQLEACKELHLSEVEFKRDVLQFKSICILPSGDVTSLAVVSSLKSHVAAELTRYHNDFPLRSGMNKAELISRFVDQYPKKLITWLVDEGVKQNWYKGVGPYIALTSFKPHPPEQWKKRVDHVLQALEKEHVKVTPLLEHLEVQHIPNELHSDISHYLVYQKLVFQLDEKLFIHVKPFKHAISCLYKQTGQQFSLQDAKEILELSRKYVVPFVEKLDQLGLTIRHEKEREWRVDQLENWLNSTS
ncbi:SelB C-terminal domain-containing protein [Bacillus sp. JCM 19034]|uniref:SelB domain-containing protein n=1 Tax=Bacillus sp. JCM 19034 TaxID=1481928 RepID=UPI000A4E6379